MILRRCLILQAFSSLAHTIMLSPNGKNVLHRKTTDRQRKSEGVRGQN